MDHTLATQLKDAGFPNIKDIQHRQGREFLSPDGRVSIYSIGEAAPTDDWFIPTLPELIEACGHKFAALHKHAYGWLASATHEAGAKDGSGSTPTEAVVRLWLALHPMNETHEGEN